MKIVILSDDFPPKSFGGAGIVAYNLACELAKSGNIVTVITTTQDEREQGEIVLDGVVVHKIYSNYHERFRAYRSLYNPQTISLVEKLLRGLEPDVVHAHNIHFYLSYYALALARRYSKVVVLTAHDAMSVDYSKLVPKVVVGEHGKSIFDYRVSAWKQFIKFRFRYNPFRNYVIRHCLKKIDGIFAVSNATADSMRQNGIDNVEVFYNGIDTSRFLVKPNSVKLFKEKYRLSDEKVMFFGGRISPAKGGDSAISILKEVHLKFPKSILLIAGTEDGYTRALLQKAREEGLENNIVFTGWLSREEMPYVYAISDVVLVLSLYMDPGPLINMEAMAARKPVVGTCFGGTSEIVNDGITGYIVNPLFPLKVAEKVVDLFSNQEKAEKMGQLGYERIVSNFNLSKKVEQWLTVYQNLIKNNEK